MRIASVLWSLTASGFDRAGPSMQPGGANISDALLTELRRIVAGDELRVSVRTSDRMAYGRDLWPRLLLGLERGVAAPFPPDAIVWPQTVEEIVALVRFAAKHRIPIVPFGGGSGVCGSALALEGG